MVSAADARLKFLLRRGTKELDVLLERYWERRYAAADPAERAAFARLLEREDPDIQQWVLGQGDAPREFARVIDELRRHH